MENPNTKLFILCAKQISDKIWSFEKNAYSDPHFCHFLHSTKYKIFKIYMWHACEIHLCLYPDFFNFFGAQDIIYEILKQ